MRPLYPLLPLLALAACEQQRPAPRPEPNAATTAERPAPAPVPPPAPSAALPRVPARFHGIWDSADAPCDPATDMRVEIAERGITFYESHGAVTALTTPAPNRIDVELAMKGEGEEWTLRKSFTLSPDGAVLTPSGGGDTGPPRPLRRCA